MSKGKLLGFTRVGTAHEIEPPADAPQPPEQYDPPSQLISPHQDKSIDFGLSNWKMLCRFAAGKKSPIDMEVRAEVKRFTEDELMQELLGFSLFKANEWPSFYRSVCLEIAERKYFVMPDEVFEQPEKEQQVPVSGSDWPAFIPVFFVD